MDLVLACFVVLVVVAVVRVAALVVVLVAVLGHLPGSSLVVVVVGLCHCGRFSFPSSSSSLSSVT